MSRLENDIFHFMLFMVKLLYSFANETHYDYEEYEEIHNVFSIF